MIKDQFQISGPYAERAIMAQIEAIQPTPEIQHRPFQIFKDIESKVYETREAALSMDAPRQGWLSGLVFKQQALGIREIIEQESVIGGQIFGEGHRFWLDAKPGQVFNSEIADWYHVMPNPLQPNSPTVLRFQTTPTTIHKLYEGREYEPTIDDIDRLTKAATVYLEKVTVDTKSNYRLAA